LTTEEQVKKGVIKKVYNHILGQYELYASVVLTDGLVIRTMRLYVTSANYIGLWYY
jgi:hypothetical protein